MRETARFKGGQAEGCSQPTVELDCPGEVLDGFIKLAQGVIAQP